MSWIGWVLTSAGVSVAGWQTSALKRASLRILAPERSLGLEP